MKWCEVFKTGTHTDASGNTKTWTTDDLENIVMRFQEQNFGAPAVVGHPKTDSPAYAWVENVKREGEKLFASFKDVIPEFAEAVNKGVFKNRSISLYPSGQIRHIGFLGGFQPAIKDLAAFQFSEDEEAETYEFGEFEDYKFQSLANILQNLRDFLIDKYDLETADRLISTWRIEDLKQIENKTSAEIATYCESFEQNTAPESTKESEIPTEFAEKINKQDARIKELEVSLDAEKQAKRIADFEQFAEKAITDGNITPAQKADAINFMEICHASGQYEFSEGDEKSVLTRFKDFLSGLKQIQFAELANLGTKGEPKEQHEFSDGLEAHNAINAYQVEQKKLGRDITPTKALQELKGDIKK